MKKSNPIGVRFDLQKLEMIQKEQNLTSVQKVVNYLMDNYQSISTSKTLLEIIDLKDEPNILGIGSNLEDVRKSVQIPVQSEKKPNLEPPSHLTGIDLVIWRAENGK
jgi:hypothetical protein